MMQKRNLKLSIVIIISILHLATNVRGQVIEHQFGETISCDINPQTIKVFLSSKNENEGLTFIVNTDGKICSSGKNKHPNDFEYMINQLTEMYLTESINLLTFERIECSLIKDKKIKDYMLQNKSNIDERYILKILNAPQCK